jgi:hypothetical protein
MGKRVAEYQAGYKENEIKMKRRIIKSQADYEKYADFDGVFIIKSEDQIVLRGNSHITIGGDSYVELTDTSQATLLDTSHALLRDASHAKLKDNSYATLRDASYATLNGNSHAVLLDRTYALLFDNAYAELRNSSWAFLWGASHAMLRDSSYAELRGSSYATALDNSFVLVYEKNAVCLFGNALSEEYVYPVYDKSILDTLAEKTEDGIILYKSVNPITDCDFFSGKVHYEIGKTVECPDWSDDPKIECGNGLHLCFSAFDAHCFKPGKILRCVVKPEDIAVHPYDISKVRCKKVKPIAVVDISGREL